MFVIEAIVDTGLYKKTNDDRILLKDIVLENGIYHEMQNDTLLYAAVADGVGGENAGDVAATETLYEMAAVYPEVFEYVEELIQNAVENSYNRLQKIVELKPECSGMATTLTGLVIVNNEIYTFNIGNSRVYRYRNGMLRQLTVDDSVVQDMVSSGMIGISDVRLMPNKNVITKYIGSNGVRFKPQIIKHEIQVRENDIFVLCSDGIHDYVTTEEIECILYENISLFEKCKRIVGRAQTCEWHDNISLILVEVT